MSKIRNLKQVQTVQNEVHIFLYFFKNEPSLQIMKLKCSTQDKKIGPYKKLSL